MSLDLLDYRKLGQVVTNTGRMANLLAQSNQNNALVSRLYDQVQLLTQQLDESERLRRQEHKNSVDEYNNLINKHNAIAEKYRALLKQYNALVGDYNQLLQDAKNISAERDRLKGLQQQ